MKVLTPDEMRRMDEDCISRYKIPAALLMENAASSSLNLISTRYPRVRNVLLVCGSGNNGGDGLALARQLHSRSYKVTVLFCGSEKKLSPPSLQNFKSIEVLDIPLYKNPSAEIMGARLGKADLIVDALFGTGLSREVSGDKAEIIKLINASPAPVLCLDIPSGLDGRNAKVRGCAVKAEATLALGAPMKGNVAAPGYLYNGALYCSRISFPPELVENETYMTELNLPSAVADRDPLGYKNSFGRVLVIGGGAGYYGAPVLAVRAAYRSGGGYVSAALPKSHLPNMAAHCPEAVLLPMVENKQGGIASENLETLLKAGENHDAVLLGPGLGRSDDTMDLARTLISEIAVPLVIDADALFALAADPALCRRRGAPAVLTPHQGERRRLEEQCGRIPVEEACNAVTVYKGPRSSIRTPDGREYINLTGCEALGTAGTGDVLAGMIAGMIPWEKDPLEATRKAVLLHGLAAEFRSGAAESFTASDLISALPETLERFRKEHEKWTREFYSKMTLIP